MTFSPARLRSGKTATLAITADGATQATVLVTRAVPGRGKGKQCKATAKRGPKCTTQVTVLKRSISIPAGAPAMVTLKGLKAGALKVTVTPTGGSPLSVTR